MTDGRPARPASDRLEVLKTYKLFIGGAFPRSESGRSEPIAAADGRVAGHLCRGSRKDVRDAVTAARTGLGKWKSATAYNRGQVLYRMAEMLEGRRAEFAGLLADGGAADAEAQAELTAAVDRLVHFAGWCDKYTQVLAGQNAVAGPYWNLSTPEPTGVVAVICPADRPLLALVSLAAPVICTGNAVVVVSPAYAPVVSTFGEVCATSDLPGGVVNLITGSVEELAPVLAGHRDVDALLAAGVSDPLAKTCREGAAENLKRVKVVDSAGWLDESRWHGLGVLEAFVETKTVWHPVGA